MDNRACQEQQSGDLTHVLCRKKETPAVENDLFVSCTRFGKTEVAPVTIELHIKLLTRGKENNFL